MREFLYERTRRSPNPPTCRKREIYVGLNIGELAPMRKRILGVARQENGDRVFRRAPTPLALERKESTVANVPGCADRCKRRQQN